MAKNPKPRTLAHASEIIFEQIRRVDARGNEFWTARDLMPVLGYKRWEEFAKVVEKAQDASAKIGQRVEDHFRYAPKMITIGKGGSRSIPDWELTRHACYLIAQNGDPRKKEIALAQNYFAFQTRKQEIREEVERLALRGKVADSNKALNAAAKSVGVVDYAQFTNAGYEGMYNGMRAKDLRQRLGVGEKESPLNAMGDVELAANALRAAMTRFQLETNGMHGQQQANRVHHSAGINVRKSVIATVGLAPEELPPAANIRPAFQRERRLARQNAGSKLLGTDTP